MKEKKLVILITAIISVLAIAIAITSVFDTFLRGFLQVPLPLIAMDATSVLVLLLVSVLFALLSALIPSYSIASMKPVDAMKRSE